MSQYKKKKKNAAKHKQNVSYMILGQKDSTIKEKYARNNKNTIVPYQYGIFQSLVRFPSVTWLNFQVL